MKATLEGLSERHERRKRSGIMLCYPFEAKRLERWRSPTVFVQPKLDGERARLQWISGIGWTLWSSTEEPLDFAVPHLIRNATLSGLPHDAHLDGELYIHGASFEEIHSIVSRSTNLHPEHTAVSFHVFDLAEPEAPQWSRFLRLRMLERDLPEGFVPVRPEPAESLDEIWRLSERFVSQGYEGFIVRKTTGLWVPRRSTEIMKFKPKQSDVYKVIGAAQLVDKFGSRKPLLGSLLCEADGETFSVGTGFSEDQREALWTAYLQHPEMFTGGDFQARINYQNITEGSSKRSKGVPRFPVFVELQLREEAL